MIILTGDNYSLLTHMMDRDATGSPILVRDEDSPTQSPHRYIKAVLDDDALTEWQILVWREYLNLAKEFGTLVPVVSKYEVWIFSLFVLLPQIIACVKLTRACTTTPMPQPEKNSSRIMSTTTIARTPNMAAWTLQSTLPGAGFQFSSKLFCPWFYWLVCDLHSFCTLKKLILAFPGALTTL